MGFYGEVRGGEEGGNEDGNGERKGVEVRREMRFWLGMHFTIDGQA